MIDSFISATIGGALIGLAASLLLVSIGRVAGISGIVGGLMQPPARDGATNEHGWRLLFVAGLLLGGVLVIQFIPTAVAPPRTRSVLAVAAAGLLVGVGTRLGSGCTSGHGVCGLSRFSIRSLWATLTFMAAGFVTATAVGRLVGGSP